jgi:hypothetical protein
LQKEKKEELIKMVRPRTTTPPPEEMILLGEEMIKWIEEKKPLHITEWYSIEKRITRNVWDTMRAAKEFAHYYEIALDMIGRQYLDKTSNVRDGISHRWQRVYYKDLKKEENEQLMLEADLKKASDKENSINLTIKNFSDKTIE